MRPDRFIAFCLLLFCIGYGNLAWHYPLLPFERDVPFRPNTMPLGLSITGVILSLAVLLFPGGKAGLSEDAQGWRNFDWQAALAVVGLMILYAGVIRPLGYIPSTVLFLVGGAAVLGERKWRILLPISITTAVFTWALVHIGLGVYLKPLPFSIQ